MRRLVLLLVLLALPATAQADCPGNAGQGCAYDATQTLGGDTSQALQRPEDAAFDGSRTFVADSDAHRLAVYDGRDRLVTTWQQGDADWHPAFVDVAADGHVLTVDAVRRCLSEFDRDGGVVAACTALPAGPEIAGMAVAPDGTVWLSFAGDRIDRVGRDGTQLQTLHHAASPGPFTATPATTARPLAVTPSGHLLIGVTEGYDELTGDGATVRHVPTTVAVQAIAALPDGQVVVAGPSSDSAQRLLRFTGDGVQNASSSGYYDVRALTNADGDVLAVEPDHKHVVRVSPTGEQAVFGIADGDALSNPSSVWDDGAGGLYVGDEGHLRVVHYDATGALTGTVASFGTLTAPEGPTAGARDPVTGALWVSTHSSVQRLGQDGAAALTLPRFAPGWVRAVQDTEGLQTGPDGTVYGYFYADDGSAYFRPQLQARDRDGNIVRVLLGSGSGLDHPGPFALAPNGDVYVVSGYDQHWKLTVLGANGETKRTSDLPGGLGGGIAIDHAGHVYLGGSRGVVVILRADGTAVGGFSTPVSDGFGRSGGIGYSDGWLSVVSRETNRVRRYHIDMSALTPLEGPPAPRLTNVRMATAKLNAHGRTVRVRITCIGYPGHALGCTGKTRLMTPGRRSLTAPVRYAIGKKTTKTITLRLTTAARSSLRRRGKLVVLLVAQPTTGIVSSVRTTLRRAR